MKLKKDRFRGPVFFCYADPTGFSGQKEATEIVIRGLTVRGWDCRRLPQPVLERNQGGVMAHGRFVLGLAAAWMRALRMLRASRGALCVNLGQTRTAFLRDAGPLLIGRLVFGRARLIVSLHGNLFMHWPADSVNARCFRALLRRGGSVTVLGEKQRAHLVALGLDAARVKVVVNSCALAPIDEAQLEEKLNPARTALRPLRILHLSSLIATKGFPEYLEALAGMAGRPGPPVEAVLCGKVAASEFQDRFPSVAAAERWIEETIGRINRSERVQVRWVRGAVGPEKEALFRAADIFVLPTRYAVEAQPIVLLEAMASGCAIVTTGAGEIPTILDKQSAIFLSAGSTAEVESGLEILLDDAAMRTRLARKAQARFVDRYRLESHLTVWEALLDSSGAGVESWRPGTGRPGESVPLTR
jgi:glycosyltransferase involved in cell wall biosynthesis